MKRSFRNPARRAVARRSWPRPLRRSLSCVALLALARACTVDLSTARGQPPRDDRPRLVVVIVVDQLCAEFLTRFEPFFDDRGFRRLMERGAWFTQAYLPYGVTSTGPGHATIATGAPPCVHGIVGNDWYAGPDRKSTYCVEDPDCKLVGPNMDERRKGRSPVLLASATLGDQLKLATAGRSKVWGASLKDRSAILLAGRAADGAVWWDGATGHFISSTYYAAKLPDCAARLNRAQIADRYFHKRWDRALPESEYARVCHADDAAHERGRSAGLTNVLPKTIAQDLNERTAEYYEAVFTSPFGNELVFELARAVVDDEQLGQDDAPDLLGISLSSNDAVGHAFGPHSHEVLDITVRTDRQLGEFLDWLDRAVGLSRCLVALTADHGVAPAPEYARDLRLGGGRVDVAGLLADIEDALSEPLAAASLKGGQHSGQRAVKLKGPWLYLNHSALASRGIPATDAAARAARAAAKSDGIARALVEADWSAAGASADSPIAFHARQSSFPGRSGDVYVHTSPYWAFGGNCAEHGTAHAYDRHVPLLIYGRAIQPLKSSALVDVCDLAVTLAALLHVPPPPAATGAPLAAVVDEPER